MSYPTTYWEARIREYEARITKIMEVHQNRLDELVDVKAELAIREAR